MVSYEMYREHCEYLENRMFAGCMRYELWYPYVEVWGWGDEKGCYLDKITLIREGPFRP